METFSASKALVENPHYLMQREGSLRNLDLNTIDAPMREIIRSFAKLPYCFTWKKHRSSTRTISNSDVRNGSGQGRSIRMLCRWNPKDSKIKIPAWWNIMRHCTLKR